MNTVDALNVLGKALCGDSFETKPGLTDAETILEIANQYEAPQGGGSGSGGPVIKLKTNMADSTTTADPLVAGLSLTDLSGATLEMYLTGGDVEHLSAICKPSIVAEAANNVIQLTSFTFGPNGLTPLVLDYNSDTGVVTILGSQGGPA